MHIEMTILNCYSTGTFSTADVVGEKHMASIVGCYRDSMNFNTVSSIETYYIKDCFAPPITNYTWQFSENGTGIGNGSTTKKLTTGRCTSESDMIEKVLYSMGSGNRFRSDYRNLNNGFPVLDWE